MNNYIYFYRGGDWQQQSPAELQEQMNRWTAWMKELAEKGHLKDAGSPLERSGKLVTGKQKLVTDGPFAEAKDVIGGYSIIEARDLAHAVELSMGCPIFRNGGTVEVRPVMKLSM